MSINSLGYAPVVSIFFAGFLAFVLVVSSCGGVGCLFFRAFRTSVEVACNLGGQKNRPKGACFLRETLKVLQCFPVVFFKVKGVFFKVAPGMASRPDLVSFRIFLHLE